MTASQIVRHLSVMGVYLKYLVTQQKNSDLDIAPDALPSMYSSFMVSPMHKSIMHGAGEEYLFLLFTT